MKIKTITEVEVKTLIVSADVRYWDNAVINGIEDDGTLIPCRNGDSWNPHIDIETGKILNWTLGTTAEIHYKVCDGCSWSLLDVNGTDVAVVVDGYVPSTLSPKENGYGDYIIMDIDENGMIADWEFKESDFSNAEED